MRGPPPPVGQLAQMRDDVITGIARVQEIYEDRSRRAPDDRHRDIRLLMRRTATRSTDLHQVRAPAPGGPNGLIALARILRVQERVGIQPVDLLSSPRRGSRVGLQRVDDRGGELRTALPYRAQRRTRIAQSHRHVPREKVGGHAFRLDR